MVAVRVEASRGWGWIVEGWRLFAQAPGIWLLIMLIYFGISLVLAFIPFVGTLASVLLGPVLAGGMIYGAAQLAQGRPLEIGHLFQGFKDQDRLGPLAVLGLIGLAGGFAAGLVMFLFMGGGLMLGGVLDTTGAIIPPQTMTGIFAGAGLLALLFILLISVLIGMAFFYSVPLVMLAGQYVWPAVQDSIAACWINFLPLLVFGLIYFILVIVASIPLGLGFFILGPVTVGALYASYRDVFERPDRPSINLAK